MPKFDDKTGRRYGLQTVIKRAENHRISNRTSIVQWLCRCDCGNEIIVRANNLTSGNTKSCGCKSSEMLRSARFVDYSGKRFCRLTVIHPADEKIRSNGYGRRMWVCQCDCGKQVVVTQDDLLSGHTKSCGCYHREMSSKSFLDDITGNRYGYLTVVRRYGTIDKDKPTWLCRCDCGKETVVRGICLKNGSTQSCGCKRFSIGELSVQNILDELNLSYSNQKTFDDLLGPGNRKLKFDFALYNKNHILVGLIEYQGQQHYEVRIDENFGKVQREITDQQKREYCLAHNIPLLEIRYDENDKRSLIIAFINQLNLTHANTVPSLEQEEGVTTIPQGST